MILTDVKGVPLDPPTLPEPGAGIEATIAWLRADNAHRDLVAKLAGSAFARGFRAVRKTTP